MHQGRPPTFDESVDLCSALVWFLPPRVIRLPNRRGEGSVENEMRDAVGVRSGEHHAYRARFMHPHESYFLGSDGVEYRQGIVQSLLKSGGAAEAIREAGPAPVEEDQSTDPRETFECLGDWPIRLEDIKVRQPWQNEQDVLFAIPDDSVGEADLTTARIPDIGVLCHQVNRSIGASRSFHGPHRVTSGRPRTRLGIAPSSGQPE